MLLVLHFGFLSLAVLLLSEHRGLEGGVIAESVSLSAVFFALMARLEGSYGACRILAEARPLG